MMAFTGSAFASNEIVKEADVKEIITQDDTNLNNPPMIYKYVCTVYIKTKGANGQEVIHTHSETYYFTTPGMGAYKCGIFEKQVHAQYDYSIQPSDPFIVG